MHEWRIQSRRLFALEELLAPAGARRDRDGLRTRFHAAFHAAGRLRDAQVAIAQLELLSPRFPASGRLLRHLQRGIPGQRDRVARRIRNIKPRALRELLLFWGILHDPDLAQLASRAELRLRRAHLRLQRAERRCRTVRTLHRYRVHLKSLRYMQEFIRAAGLRMPSSLAAPRHIDRLQRELGEISDIRVLIGLLDRFAAKHPAWKRKSSALRRDLLRQQRRMMSLAVVTDLRQLPMGNAGRPANNSSVVSASTPLLPWS